MDQFILFYVLHWQFRYSPPSIPTIPFYAVSVLYFIKMGLGSLNGLNAIRHQEKEKELLVQGCLQVW